MTPGKLIDDLVKLRAKRLGLERQVTELKRQESGIADTLVSELRDASLDRASGKSGTFSFKVVPVGVVEDWGKFLAFRGAQHLLQRRIHQGALQERREAGKKLPPGVKIESVVKTTLTEKR